MQAKNTYTRTHLKHMSICMRACTQSHVCTHSLTHKHTHTHTNTHTHTQTYATCQNGRTGTKITRWYNDWNPALCILLKRSPSCMQAGILIMCMGQIFSNVHLSHCMLHPGRINIAYKAQNQTHQLHNPVPMTCFVHKVLQHFSHTQAERITYSYRALSQFCCTRVCSTQSGLCTHIEHET